MVSPGKYGTDTVKFFIGIPPICIYFSQRYTGNYTPVYNCSNHSNSSLRLLYSSKRLLSSSFRLFWYNIFMKIFGERLKELRTSKGITQSELAKATGYTQSMIAKWENGVHEPIASVIVAMADYFGICADYLLGRKDYY